MRQTLKLIPYAFNLKKCLCNSKSIKDLHEPISKGAYFEFKRALVSIQKGTSCKPIKRLFEAKRASYKKEDVKNNYIRCEE